MKYQFLRQRTRKNRNLGSTRASRVGCRASRQQTLKFAYMNSEHSHKHESTKFAKARAPSPAREARALSRFRLLPFLITPHELEKPDGIPARVDAADFVGVNRG